MKGFTIYREYFDLITLLPKKEQGELILAICDYMFLNTIPNLNESQMKIFKNLKRPLDKSKNKSKNSSNNKSNENQIEIKIEPEQNQNEDKTETHQDVNVNVYVNVFNSLEELVNYIQKELNFILHNTSVEFNTLQLWIDNKIPKEVIKYSFEEARRKNKNDINYINGIVNKKIEDLKKKKQEDNSELPEWFNKKIEKNTEGLEEMEKILDEFK